MDWDQKLFRKVYHFFQNFRQPKVDPQVAERTVALVDIKGRLEILAKALTGAPIVVHQAENEGGVHGDVFFLPEKCNLFEEYEHNMTFYLYRVCFLTVQSAFEEVVFSERSSDDDGERRLSDASIRYIIERMYQEWPMLSDMVQPLFQQLKDKDEEERELLGKYLYGRKIRDSVLDRMAFPDHQNPLAEPGEEEEEEETSKSEFKAPPKEEIETLQVDQKTISEYTLLHQFEKVETLDEFRGQWRTMDGEDDLQEHLEALQELDLCKTVRSDVPTHSIYQADFVISRAIPESEAVDVDEPCLEYPEWNHKKKKYLENYCKVFPKQQPKEDTGYLGKILDKHRSTLVELRKKLAHFRMQRELRKRQPDGEYPDLDAVVDSYATLKAGRTPNEKVYLSRRPKFRDVAVLVLLDCSLSTDGFTDGRRIIDVEKESILLFGQILEENHESFQIDAFCSRTRNYCNYISLKSFKDKWHKGASKLGALQPAGYTRIGPALRHAIDVLEKQKAEKKWILLLSDGKPNDYDRYEGEYGIQDVRQAIREAFQKDIHIYALAIEKAARHYLPRMLGKSNYKILPKPEDLPDALLYFYSRLL